jgi:hypothetical protein
VYIKNLSLNIKIFSEWKIFQKNQRPHRKFWFKIVDDKKKLSQSGETLHLRDGDFLFISALVLNNLQYYIQILVLNFNN